jgi:hypothetical protein
MIKHKKYNPAIHLVHLNKLYPDFRYSWKRGQYVITGTLQPTEHSPKYQIEITCKQSMTPQTKVLDPLLEKNTPHVFRDKGTLCLFHKNDFQWNEKKKIAETILPWTSAWLYFYEVWLETGIWFGEEYPHQYSEEKQSM